jgi:hypothetical protein
MNSNAKRYTNAGIFLDDIWTVFLPNFPELCRLNEFAEEMVVLLMDNGSSHITSDMSGLLTEAPAHVIIVVPHNLDVSSH